MEQVRDFSNLAGLLLERRPQVHITILLVSLLMIPGMLASLTPIDIEAYDMESPELTAYKVLNEDFASAEVMYGMMVSIRDPTHYSSGPEAPHRDAEGNVLTEQLPQIEERIAYPGDNAGLVGEGVPIGGILNLTVLREIDGKAAEIRADPISEFSRPMVSELTGEGSDGVLALPDQFRSFMSNRSMLTRDTVNEFGQFVPARTNWTDCWPLECLEFDDPGITQSHIDLAAHRMIASSEGVFMRWMSTDRGFTSDPSSPVIGPIGGRITEDGTFEGAEWGPGRWSASTTWMLLQVSRDAMEESGFTHSWSDARSEPDGWSYHGLQLLTTPPHRTSEECRALVEGGGAPCAAEWAIVALEENIRATDQLTVSMIIGEGINVEVNRELQESAILLAGMAIAILVLLWFSLRRLSDVAIVGATLVFSLLWMQGLIGWGIIAGSEFDLKIISRSQFSNLLPILILALGIDDSLHALHRYKEERRNGKPPEDAARVSLTRVGRAIMLTSFTTMAAFAANFTSDIPALRSFGLEAAFGVGSAFILTGLWAPIIRLDWDLWILKRGELGEEDGTTLHMVREEWLAEVAGTSSKKSSFILAAVLVLSALAVPMMLGLEGDFKVEDFLDGESDFAQGIEIVNTRFTDEGEPAAIVIEGDMLDPRVYAAIGATRENMLDASADDPQRFTRTPLGVPELHGVDELALFAMASMGANATPFIEAGWASESNSGCAITSNGLPETTDRDCLRFLYGFLFTHGIPEGGLIPHIPASIIALYILPSCELDPQAVHLCSDGSGPSYERMTLRWGVSDAEKFNLVELTLAELERDMAPFQELAGQDISLRVPVSEASEEFPVTWAMPTGDPVTRYVAASSMQNELQGTLMLGVVFCLITLWWGFRRVGASLNSYSKRELVLSLPVIAGIAYFVFWSTGSATISAVITVWLLLNAGLWGTRALSMAMVTTTPIIVVVIWLYAIIYLAGYGLNMVTVAIAAMSLGVGIDYVIHVVERYREEHSRGVSSEMAVRAIGGAAGLALFGSAVSDVTGFLIIAQSPMGFFSSFGLFCATMIGLSLLAGLVLTPALLSTINRHPSNNSV